MKPPTPFTLALPTPWNSRPELVTVQLALVRARSRTTPVGG